MLVALVAVSVPSAAVSSRGFVSNPHAILLQADNGTYVQAPCFLQGNKRVSHCRPDLGVIPVAVAVRPVRPVVEQPVTADLMPRPMSREPSLPPPRLA
jgi:hypothetical protein